MASPGDFKGQRRGACGHVMAAFDLHERCARCREKKIGDDPCVKDKSCSLCDNFSDSQRETISTPSYRIRKDRKAGLLVSPKEVTVISPVEDLLSANVPADNSSAQPSAQVAPDLQPSAQISAQAPAASSSSKSDTSYVTSDQFSALSDKMAEQFARFEALLSRGNIFSAPKMPVNPMSTHQVPSDTPFLDPNLARPTGPVWLPAGSEDDKGSDSKHEKKKSHKSKHRSDKKSDKKSRGHSDKPDKSTNRNVDKVDSHAPVGALTSSTGITPAGNLDTPGPGVKQMPSTSHLSQSTVHSTGQPVQDSSAADQTSGHTMSSSAYSAYGPTGADDDPPASACSGLPEDPEDSDHYTVSEPDEGELSDSGKKQEVTEDMNYRKLSGQYDHLWGGITSSFLRRISMNPTRVTKATSPADLRRTNSLKCPNLKLGGIRCIPSDLIPHLVLASLSLVGGTRKPR